MMRNWTETDAAGREYSVYRGTADDFVAGHRQRVAEEPDNDVAKMMLASSLFMSGHYSEAIEVASKLQQDGVNAGSDSEPPTRDRALKEVTAALKRCRGVLKEYASPLVDDDFRQRYLDQYEMLIHYYENDLLDWSCLSPNAEPSPAGHL